MGLLASSDKLFIGLMIGNLYVYMAEIFPSVFRGIGCSLVTVIGRIGNVFAPLLCNYLESRQILP